MESSRPGGYALDRILGSAIFGFASGIIFDAFFRFRFDIYIVLFMALICVGLGILKKSQVFFCISIGIFALLLGIIRMEISSVGIYALEHSVGQKVTLTGVIDAPSQKQYNQEATLSLDDGETILIYVGNYPTLSYGDKISVTGILQKPKNFTTDQGAEFDYISYLYKDDIIYVLPNAKATIIAHSKGSPITGPLLSFKNWFIEGYEKILPPDDADLMGGLTLGTKENISKEFRDNLITTSTIHIIALSGYNVTIVASFLQSLLAHIPFLGARGALIGGGIGIILFVVMTGMQSSAIRAGIMALIGLFGRGTGRMYDAFRALICAGLVMIIWNPKYLVYDVSFQLSYLATLGMIFLTPIFLHLFRGVPENILKKIPLRELMSTTLGAQTAVMPFIIYKMGVLSIIALPANIFVLPAVPIAMGIGTVAGIIGNVSRILATPFAYVTHLLLTYITVMVNFFAHVPFAYVALKNVSIFLCLFFYAILILWIWQNRGLYKTK